MALLVDIDLPEWIVDEEFRDYLLESLPGEDIRCFAEMGALEDIEMLASGGQIDVVGDGDNRPLPFLLSRLEQFVNRHLVPQV